MISWIDCIGPYGMAGAIKVMDPFQWLVQTPRELAEEAERRRNREEHGVSQTDEERAK